jgi:hypothetical protein
MLARVGVNLKVTEDMPLAVVTSSSNFKFRPARSSSMSASTGMPGQPFLFLLPSANMISRLAISIVLQAVVLALGRFSTAQ